jgi:geranylgeranyl diphosphate synthase, type II
MREQKPQFLAMTPTQESTAFQLKAYLLERQTQVEAALDRALPLAYPEKIYEAMRYSLLAGGKRLRPILTIASCELLGGTSEMAMATACAMEMVHTMSLIHDDLPAMDNDDYRRGKLTNHKVYGEDIAILAGDGLLAYAFEHIAKATTGVPIERILQAVIHLTHASGAAGLVGGQVVDLESEGKSDVTLETLGYIHAHKTGALLESCVVCGGIIAGGSATDLERLSRYAQNIGLAFQIIDDILDITATSEELGKSAGKDLEAEKATYPKLLGIEESQRQATELVTVAKTTLEVYGAAAAPLQALADFITDRRN